jgi:AcrR family transcriptional regulator
MPTITRQTLLEAALDVLREFGAEGLRVRAVADRAGCSTTGVYTYFGSKQGLVDALFVDGFERFDAALATTPPDDDPLVHLRARAVAYRRWALDNPMHYMLMFGGSVPEYEPSETALTRSYESFLDLVRCVEAVAADGQLRAGDANDFAAHLWATIHGYVMLDLRGMSVYDETRRADAYHRGLHYLIDGIGTTRRRRAH